jgi:hypothetical protein
MLAAPALQLAADERQAFEQRERQAVERRQPAGGSVGAGDGQAGKCLQDLSMCAGRFRLIGYNAEEPGRTTTVFGF